MIESKIHVSRVIERKRDQIVLGVYSYVEGKRIGTSVVVPREFDDQRIKRVLDYGEEALRKQVNLFLAQRAKAQ